MDPIAVLQFISQLVTAAAALLPQIEANISQGEQIAGTTDPAALNAQIVQLHNEALALTATLDGLRDAAS
jgi:hypothetical protein